MKHPLPSSFISEAVSIALVGCGGNGTQMLTGLARMHVALRALGHPGFKVTVFDSDRVSESNIGRQLFSPADVGQYKATLLVHRMNIFFGLGWEAVPEAFPVGEVEDSYFGYGLIIGCVDSRKSRRAIHTYGRRFRWGHGDHARAHYWLDVGNLNNTGQVVLGQFNPVFDHRYRAPRPLIETLTGNTGQWAETLLPLHLPNVTDLFPDILDSRVPETDIPSCSLAEALESQDLFVNQAVTTFALQLLWMWFRQGGLDHHGYFVNLATGRVSPLPIDKETWRRFNPAICGEAVKPLESKKKKTQRRRGAEKRTE